MNVIRCLLTLLLAAAPAFAGLANLAPNSRDGQVAKQLARMLPVVHLL